MTAWVESTWLYDAPRWWRDVTAGWSLEVLSHRDGTFSWASYGPGWRVMRPCGASGTGLPSAGEARGAADRYVADLLPGGGCA